MKILFVASECYPLIKTGGLADVVGALPLALAPLGCEVRVLLPGYPSVLEKLARTEVVAPLPKLFGGEGQLIRGTAGDGLEMLVIKAPHLFNRPGNPYLNAKGRDWPDNHLRFGALSRVAAEIGLGRLGDWRPDLVNAHDWQAGPTSAYMQFSGKPRPPVVFTIHNIAFQGLFRPTLLKALGLPRKSFTVDGLEYYGKVSFMKAGLVYADHITTVSPTYARELQTEEAGMGLAGLLRHRAGDLTGIVNGIDGAVWNPAEDPAIDAPYTARSLKGKARNKVALQVKFGLDRTPDAPLFCVISRLTVQKGLDLLLDALPTIIGRGGQLAVLGTGEPVLEKTFVKAAKQHAGRVGVEIGYDEALSHRMQAGADAIIIPSRFEPCGLTQLYGLRYGTLPIVARVGGLADTVVDANEAALGDGVATGFQFAPVTAEALHFALQRACDVYADRPVWQAMQRRAMGREVGWSAPAADYLRLYRRLAPEPVS